MQKAKGYSLAWLHHKGRNKHHYEYWVDNMDNGGMGLNIPIKYKKEMICDYMGAGKAYYGKSFTIEKEYKWWQDKKSKPLVIHKETLSFIDDFFENLLKEGEKEAFKFLKNKER